MNTETEKLQDVEESICKEQFQPIFEEIKEMLNYAREEGKVVPEPLRLQLAELCTMREQKGSSSSDPCVETTPQTSSNKPALTAEGNLFAKALEVHSGLSQLVAPANPVTIRATSDDWKLYWKRRWAIYFLLVISIFSLVMFLGSAFFRDRAAYTSKTGNGSGSLTAPQSEEQRVAAEAQAGLKSSSQPQDDSSNLCGILMLLAAAGLGSGFYGLYTAYDYYVNRTYDPRYNQTYLVRYILGLTAGTILGYFGTNMLGAGSSAGPATAAETAKTASMAKDLGPSVLALVGGYAAEAVSQILQRMAETLVTVVRGSNADELKAKQEELKSKTKQELVQKKMDMLKPLQKAKEAAVAAGTAVPSQLHEAIQDAIDSVSK